jgi:hypothetical protein
MTKSIEASTTHGTFSVADHYARLFLCQIFTFLRGGEEALEDLKWADFYRREFLAVYP